MRLIKKSEVVRVQALSRSCREQELFRFIREISEIAVITDYARNLVLGRVFRYRKTLN